MRQQPLTELTVGTAKLPPALLGPDDPAPFEVFNPQGRRSALVICDHASRVVPRSLDGLGLDEAVLRRHVGWDIGAAEVSRLLATALDAPALLGGYSRLVIDLNRRLDDPTSICVISDGVVVPGNRGLAPAAVHRRVAAIFRPYHRAVAAAIAGFRGRGIVPAIVSVHSCTPVMRGVERPWHVGVLWDRDRRIATPLMGKLAADPALCVGDNQPYSGRDRVGFSIDGHARAAGLPNVLIEIRQDLIDTHHGAERWAGVLAPVLGEILADPGLYRAERCE
jgi:predicted N-formylglutamate amidohydrolase